MMLKVLLSFIILLKINYISCQKIITASKNVLAPPGSVNTQDSRTLPNFVIILMDDMGWGDLGCFGEPNRETPNIDMMAKKGLTVTNMYTSNPLCSPSRASLLTGRLPIRNGFYTTNIHGRNSYTPQEIVGGIPPTEILLPELLKTKNYTNALIGKWHLGHQKKYLPLKRGFDKFFGSTNCHFGPYDNKNTPNIPVFRNSKMIGRYYQDFQIERSSHESNMTLLFIEEAVKFISNQQKKDSPFFLLWAPDAVHAPTYASPKFLGTSRRGAYGDTIREIDYGVGVILKTLAKKKMDRNTLVVFTSDNGAALVSKTQGGSNGPLLCGKQTTFEGGMRIPAIFWWPGTIPTKSLSHQVWTQMDLFATILDFAQIPLPKDRIIDGISLRRNLISPEDEIIRAVYFYRGDRLMATRLGKYKMQLWTWNTTPKELKHGIDFCPGQRMVNITTEEPFDHSEEPLLYNVEADPGEKYPISSHSAEYKSAIQTILKVVSEHNKNLIPGTPQLNWCDRAVMHWSPPGCSKLGECLPRPPSKPYLCQWPH